MLIGKLSDCPVSVEQPCLSYCDFNKLVRNQFEPIGVYGSETILYKLVDALIEEAYETYVANCGVYDFTILKTSITRVTCLPALVIGECVTWCGGDYQTYDTEVCTPCPTPPELSNEFLEKLPVFLRLPKTPTRQTYDAIADLFGWEIVYTLSSILIVVALDSTAPNPYYRMNEVNSILHRIPVPLGESVKIAIAGSC